MIINLISGPRNISTALMYSFGQRTDATVLDEPFYAVYLDKSGVEHPGKEDVLASLPVKESQVHDMIRAQTHTPVLFIKNMAHHMEVLEHPWIQGAVNVFLIRDPALIIASYSAVIDTPVMRDIGIKYQYELFTELNKNDEQPIVLDSGLLLEDPEKVLGYLCNLCGIVFEQRMLHWPKGPKPYDGVWSTHWYGNVHESTGFTKQSRRHTLPSHLQLLYEEARMFYEKLLPISLKA